MKTVVDLLRDADPAGFEPPWSARERSTVRQVVVDAAHDVGKVPSRALALVTVAAIPIAVAIMFSHIPRTAVDVLAAVRLEVRLAEENPTLGLREAAVAETGRRIYLHQEVVITNIDIARAEVVPGGSPSTYSVAIRLNPQGAARMRQATERHVGRPMAILIDGKVVLAPVVRSAVGASGVITGDYTKAEAERIAAGILGQ